MISGKKNYVEQLLHLALTLSLLRVDPENYLDLQWETRLAGTGVGGWQLELRAAPLTDQTYVNRKALPSIIEDLARFDTQYNVPTHFDLQAYLLNIQNSNSTNQTSTTRASSPAPEPPNSTSSVTIDLPTFESFDTEDIFLNPDPFADSSSILEQNMADLEDFGEAPINTYALDAIPLKNEPPPMFEDLIRLPFEPNFFQQHVLDQELNDCEELEEPSSSHHECCQSCDARSKQSAVKVKEEPLGEEHDPKVEGAEAATPNNNNNNTNVVVKQEPKEEFFQIKKEELDLDDSQEQEAEVPAPVTAELTQEEMDLIEVLWKQDVDLGFTLTPLTVSSGTSCGGGSGTKGANAGADSSDDLEKLKVLLEIKNDDDKKKDNNDKQPEENPWAGLSYTVDIETGEYVLNATDGSEATLPPPLADLFLEEGLNLPDLINDTAIEETEEPAKKKTTAEQDEEEECEVKRIERELESSADELCQGAAAAVAASVSATSGSSSSDLSDQATSATSSTTATTDQEKKDDDPEAASGASSDDLEDILCDMMIQTSASHFQHPRQPMQNYGHGMHGSLRQGGYHHHHHHHHHQSRVPLSRAVSMEQRFQDLANLLSFPPGMGVGMGVADMPPAHPHPHYPPHYSYQANGAIPQHGQYHSHAVLQNASLADIGPTQPYYAPNLGSAVASSMHLTNSTSETDAGATGYKMDHEMMYYSNTSSEMNHTDGFLNSILDDDLQLMDIAVNEGMYTMRMLDHNATSNNSSVLGGAIGGSAAAVAAAAAASLNGPAHLSGLMSSASAAAAVSSGAMQTSLNGGGSTGGHGTSGGTTSGDRLDASSDSAVSSMGSERVPSLSDGEWGDGGSDSAQEYHNKYGGPFDYSYSGNNRLGDGTRQPPVAQKKHHMFAKRYFQEQNTTIPSLPSGPNPSATGATVDPQTQLNNPASVPAPRSHHHDVIHHNHTYTLPHNSGANPKPQTRDKRIRKAEEEHLTRDEKRARALQIPIPVQDIINLPMDEFNERLSKYDLSENQLSLIRDIRRRGKNKVAAQNCRKRKLDQIVTLADEVKDMKQRKERLLRDREIIQTERKRIRDKFSALYRHVFQNLRDSEGNPYSQEHWSLQQSADGTVVLVPRSVDRQQDLTGSSHQQQQQQQQLGMAGGSGLPHPHHQQQHLLHLQQQHQHSQQHQHGGPNGTNSSATNGTGAGGGSQHRPKE
ncbi:segmentation protein cap'n'collar isoform X2 [Aedes albopictus]|uniref:BZIP domain-containing protein n=1 Tax=Aedes albopictus TaxID=7160 RepID=A0ABM1Z2M2_AEDAL